MIGKQVTLHKAFQYTSTMGLTTTDIREDSPYNVIAEYISNGATWYMAVHSNVRAGFIQPLHFRPDNIKAIVITTLAKAPDS